MPRIVVVVVRFTGAAARERAAGMVVVNLDTARRLWMSSTMFWCRRRWLTAVGPPLMVDDASAVRRRTLGLEWTDNDDDDEDARGDGAGKLRTKRNEDIFFSCTFGILPFPNVPSHRDQKMSVRCRPRCRARKRVSAWRSTQRRGVERASAVLDVNGDAGGCPKPLRTVKTKLNLGAQQISHVKKL